MNERSMTLHLNSDRPWVKPEYEDTDSTQQHFQCSFKGRAIDSDEHVNTLVPHRSQFPWFSGEKGSSACD
ncbi:hypothetical protein AN958_09268 [Leucoagaricus sp. SymC.cos]|nr:hypothetical protein AN958_09268 [Leucoagaricus sp. SymC.cos]